MKTYAYENGLTYKYYQPANGDQATDDDRYDAMKAAAEAGAKVIVCAGFMQGTALAKAAAEYPQVKFVFIDGWAFDGMDNEVGVAYKEEQCGYFAGYAVVMDGFEKLGFSGGGGGTNPAYMRYGYGFAQGANDAAAKLGKTVELKYTWAYGASFSPSAELQTLISGWYETGTEIVFACGGGIYTSAVDAAKKVEGAKVIGVDVDQAGTIAAYAAGEDGNAVDYADLTVTSAMKGLAPTVKTMLTAVISGNFGEYGGKVETLGLVSENPEENYVQIAGSTQFGDGFSSDDYAALVAKLYNGEVTVSNDISITAADNATVVAVTDLGNIK